MSTNSGSDSKVISLPKGGGAVKGIGETFQPNLFSGTGDFSIPIATSPGRSGFGPQLTLQYSTGNGNGSFGLGWQLSIPRITRKTEKGLPRYTDEDVFVLSGAEDLVVCAHQPAPDYAPPGYTVTRYRPRTEGLFARIEKWVRQSDGDTHWRATTKDNVTSLYGKSESARITDPANPKRVFQWLLEESFDSKGNHILYEYVQESTERSINEIYERNRTYSQVYIRRILYGNTPDSLPAAKRVGPVRTTTHHQHHRDPDQQLTRHYAFEVLFDYGDQPTTPAIPFSHPAPETTIPNNWPVREDPFSTFRAGFEIRILRRCMRVLMLHHFNEGELTGAPLVKSTDFSYQDDSNTQLSFLTAATVTGYRKGSDGHYISAAMPPVEFTYSSFEPQKQRYQSVTAEGHDLPPRSLNDPSFTLVDLFGDALPDILRTSETGYDFWQNLGNAHLDRRHPQHGAIPPVSLAQPNVAFGDMGGDGLADLLIDAPPISGFFEATPDGQWQPFRRFAHFPSLNLADPNLRLVDLTGDGLSDILITRDHHFLWFRCLGEEGYAEPEAIARIHDLDAFPDVYFSDPAGRVRLADMTGDGLNDIVLMHDGHVDYWPNFGYGRFGRRITMAAAPRIGYGFDPKRLFLVDLDGSGCADLLYVDFDSVHFWFNRSGNTWSDKQTINGTPVISDLTAIQFADFFGTGTAALVWSYDYAFQPGGNYKVLDFCGGQKPYLLTEVSNNLGATTRVQYAPSTKFYLEDKANGQPWITTLPFPVQVVEKVEVIDHIGKTKLVTRYKYHHGYFDGREREFRGFGRVDQFDTEVFEDFAGPGLHGQAAAFENNDRAHHQPPVETRSWFHTGIYYDPDRCLDHRELTLRYQDEYYQGDPRAFEVEEHDFEQADGSSGVGAAPHEAFRALRGALLRTEVYGRDGTESQDHPYLVTHNRYGTKQLQEKNGSRHGVYYTYRIEGISYHYERNPDDPRIGHQLTLEVDAFGNVTRSAAVGYPRRVPEYDEQGQTLITCSQANFVNTVDEPDRYRIGVPYDSRTFELTGLLPSDSDRPFTVQEIRDSAYDAPAISYETEPDSSALQKRLIDASRVLYWEDDLSGSLALGAVGAHALPYESYQMALTPGLVEHIYEGRVDDRLLAEEGRYIRGRDIHISDDMTDEAWWIPSGRQRFSVPDFYLPVESIDPFDNTFYMAYDDYRFLISETRDPLENVVSVINDYRTLQPWQVTEPNGNRSQVAFDALGMVAGTAIMGKAGEHLGDSLEGFETDLDPEILAQYVGNPLADPHAILGRATSRIVYDLDRYRRGDGPAVVCTLARETHDADLEPGQQTRIQHSFLYSDGFGREAMSKVQAEPGPTPMRDPETGRVVVVDGEVRMTDTPTDPRWAGTGRTIYDNKGKPIKKYEPFFSDTHGYENETALVQWGVTPVLRYDPLGRLIRTDNPDGTFSKVEFDPWQQTTWDANDTVLESDWYQERGAPDPEGDEPRGPDAQERRAAHLTAQHADTPGIVHLDTLGRTFLALADNKDDHLYHTHTILDIEGNPLLITDDRDNPVMDYRMEVPLPGGGSTRVPGYDVAGRQLYQKSMDAGERWLLPDVGGAPMRTWNSRCYQTRPRYDALRRPSHLFVHPPDVPEFLAEFTVYGEEHPDAETLNLRGKAYQLYDGAGVVTTEAYDFKGNPLRSTRQLASEYKRAVDWSSLGDLIDPAAIEAAAMPLLEQDTDEESFTFTTRTVYDALNRPISAITPDRSETLPTYNEANMLETMRVSLRGAETATDFVANIDYNAKGQREAIQYGNGAETRYSYDPHTFRLVQLYTRRDTDFTNDCGDEPPPPRYSAPERPPQDVPCGLQNLHYTYDPAGNITHIRDDAQQTIFFRNHCVEPSAEYAYDALYRLIKASGREHLGQNPGGGLNGPVMPDHTDAPRVMLDHPGDCNAMGNYTQWYDYDSVGNILAMRHQAGSGGWGRCYQYANDSNRLLSTGRRNDIHTPCPTPYGDEPVYLEHYTYDAHGSMTTMPHLPLMRWDFKDQLQASTRQVVNNGGTPEITYYVYDAAGQRVRKVTERQAGPGGTPRKKNERIYLGGFEVYREYDGDGENREMERETLRVMDNQQRIALVETRTLGDDEAPQLLVRFQLGNHLGSASLELDAVGHVISYEEYHPYGTSSYQAVRSQTETPKRYRYTGMERDEETGLNYHMARYYATWLGRWMSADPLTMSLSISSVDFRSDYLPNDNQFLGDKGLSPYISRVLALREHKHTTLIDRKTKDDEQLSLVLENTYAYCDNNPIKYVDLNGLSWTDDEGNIFSDEELENVRVYIFHDEDFSSQAMTQYRHAVELYGEEAVALSNTGTTVGFSEDWGNMRGDIRSVMITMHGRNQNIVPGEGQQFTSTGIGITNISRSEAPNIQDLPQPVGTITAATLYIYSCHSADTHAEARPELDQGPLIGTGMPVAQAFSHTFAFNRVRGTADQVNFYNWSEGALPSTEHYLLPFPVDSYWVHFRRGRQYERVEQRRFNIIRFLIDPRYRIHFLSGGTTYR
ncbi:MAG: hypothetical protein KAV87_41290 [Desulfobacteraceae bacterium]|nr:hypothetical protein [Desulfobacteraceae bacterium]